MASKKYSGICSGCGKKSDKLTPYLGMLLCEECLKEVEELGIKLAKAIGKVFGVEEERAVEIYRESVKEVTELYEKYIVDEKKDVG